MNILITNDDGYLAEGIRVLARRLGRDGHSVHIVAPTEERSGFSHLVNFYEGITCRKQHDFEGIPVCSVDGSPADCVLFAVKELYKDVKFDVVLSGINNVLNIGSDIIYSGTFGAAQEGTFHRIPSIAISLKTKGVDYYDDAADFVAENLETLKGFARENITVNVNIPSPYKEDVKGVRAAHVVYRPYDEGYVLSRDEIGNNVYTVQGRPNKVALEDKEGDCALNYDGYITLSPVKMIASDFSVIEEMKKAEFKL